MTDNERLVRQLQVVSETTPISSDDIYLGTAVIWEATRRAYGDALAWVAESGAEVAAAQAVGVEPGPAVRHDPHRGDLPPDQMAL